MAKRFIIAGGGTGGHIFPAVAIANALKLQIADAVFLFVGAKGKMEMEKIPQAGFQIQGLDIAGFNRSSLIKNIFLPYKLVKSFFQVAAIFKQFKPDAVIGVGGYSTFPVLKYAQSVGIPSFIHEANSFAGKSNMLLAKNAVKVFTATDGMEKFFPKEKIVVTGNPVRAAIANSVVNKSEALHYFGLSTEKKTVLAIGGSLGAKSINEAIKNNFKLFEDNQLQLIWQTGTSYFNTAKDCAKQQDAIVVNDFINRMDYAYAAADVVISRSGAMSIAELCIVQKPVVFVPYPFAAEDHQKANAMNLVNKHAALMVEDKDALEKLVPAIIDLVNNESRQVEMKNNMGKEAIANADTIVAKEIINALS